MLININNFKENDSLNPIILNKERMYVGAISNKNVRKVGKGSFQDLYPSSSELP